MTLRLSLLPLAAALLFPAAASAADFVYATEATPATRWMEADSAEVGLTRVGQRMEVLFEEGDRVRVRLSGGTFGWLDAAQVSETDPNPAEEGGLQELPQIKLGEDGKLELPPSLQLGNDGQGLKLDLGGDE